MRRAARLGDGWMPYLDVAGRLRPLGRRRAHGGGGHRPRPRRASSGSLYLYCSVRADGDRAREDVPVVPRRRLRRQARRDARPHRARPAPPTRWPPGSRRTSTPVCATSSSRRRRPTTRSRSSAGGRGGPAPAGGPDMTAAAPARSDRVANLRGLPAPIRVANQPAADHRVREPSRPPSADPCREAGGGLVSGPFDGLSVVEVAVGASDLGLGLAGGVPGMVLADLGATVVRVVGTEPVGHRSPTCRGAARGTGTSAVVATDDAARDRCAARATADVALVYGDEPTVEGRGLGYDDVAVAEPGARLRPLPTQPHGCGRRSTTTACSSRPAPGFCTQLDGPSTRADLRRRPGRRHRAPRSC